MHLTVLSRGLGVHTTRRLVEAADRLGVASGVVDPSQVQMGLGLTLAKRVRGRRVDPGPVLTLGDGPFPATDVVVPRFGQSVNAYGVAVVEQLEIAGIPSLNAAQGIRIARNQTRLLQLLARSGLRVPPTLMGQGAAALRRMVESLGGVPVVIRALRAGERSAVIVCETLQSLEAALEAVLSMGHDIVVQRYVSPGEGRDVRALVVGGEVRAALRRRARAGKVRRSLGTGADVETTTLTKAETRLATDAARIVGLDVAAVDLLVDDDGPTVFEVHASPGLRELEEVSHEDLAVVLIERAIALAGGRRKARKPRKSP